MPNSNGWLEDVIDKYNIAAAKKIEARKTFMEAKKVDEDLIAQIKASPQSNNTNTALQQAILQDIEEELLDEDKAYAKGTKNSKGGLSLVNDGNGPEMIVTKRGVLIPLSKGDGVIPADLTENLINLAKAGALPVQTSNVKPPEYHFDQNVNQNMDVHFDSLIRIDGNVDEKVMPQIEEIAKGLINNTSFKRNIYTFTSKELAKDMKKAGY